MFNWTRRSDFTEAAHYGIHLHLSVIIQLNMVFWTIWPLLVGRDWEEWAAIIIPLYVSGSVAVSVRGRRWKPVGDCWLCEVLHLRTEAARPLAEPQLFGWRSAEAASSGHFTGWSSHTVLQVLKQEKVAAGSKRLYSFIIMQTSFWNHCQFSFIPHLLLSRGSNTSICDQFVWFMCQKLAWF